MTEEPFDFLGYTFGPLYWPRTGGRYLGATPSRKAIRRLRGRIRTLLRPGNKESWEEVVETLNATLWGWANYFSYGTLSKARRGLDHYVYDRVRHFHRRRSGVGGHGTRHWPKESVFGALRVLSLSSLSIHR